jgi:hypothetical protein
LFPKFLGHLTPQCFGPRQVTFRFVDTAAWKVEIAIWSNKYEYLVVFEKQSLSGYLV